MFQMSSPSLIDFTISPNGSVTLESNYTLSHTENMTPSTAKQMSSVLSVGGIVGVTISTVVLFLVLLLLISFLFQRKVRSAVAYLICATSH